MGSAAAWWLSRQGRSVRLFERYRPGHANGSSHGTSRVFRLAYPDPLYVQMAKRALPLWHELEADAGTTLLTTTGGIDHGRAVNVAGLHDTVRSQGARSEVLAAAEAQQRWPYMRFDGPVLFQPDAGRLNADRVVAALHERATVHGAEMHFNEPVLDLQVGDHGVGATTPLGTYRGATAIIAAGAWTVSLLSGLVVLPALRVVQAEVFHFPPNDDGDSWPAFNHEEPGLNMYGVATALDGVKVAEHRTTGPVATADSRGFDIEPAIRERVRRYVQQWLPGLKSTVLGETTCLYTMTHNEDFFIDRTGPLVIASPCSGHGFKFTPLIGQILANMATGATAPDPRFTLL